MRHVVWFVLLALSGCQQQAPDVIVARPDVILPEISDTCGTESLLWLIGKDFTRLSEATPTGDLRILRPGTKVDGSISPSRMNAQLDSTGKVRRLFCG